MNFDYIIFDLGGVLLNLSYQKTIDSFMRANPNVGPDEFMGKQSQLAFFSEYETGRISTTDFINEFNSAYDVNFSRDEFEAHWNEMILDFPIKRIELLETLREKGKKVFLLSNINEIHERAVAERFKDLDLKKDFFELFDKAYYSHHIGMRKPNTEIFEFVVSQNAIDKKKCLFIDDSIQHIESARNYGLNALHLVEGMDVVGLNGSNS